MDLIFSGISFCFDRTFKEHSKPLDLEEICRDLCTMLSNDLQSEGLLVIY